MIRVKWRSDGEWFAGVSGNGPLWSPHRGDGLIFEDPRHFRRFEREMAKCVDPRNEFAWGNDLIAFVKVKP